MNVKSLSDDDSYDEEENISGNGDKERYFFSSDSDKIFFLVTKWTVHNYVM